MKVFSKALSKRRFKKYIQEASKTFCSEKRVLMACFENHVKVILKRFINVLNPLEKRVSKPF